MTNTKNVFLLGMSGHALSVLEAMRVSGLVPTGYFAQSKNEEVNLSFYGDETSAANVSILSSASFVFPAVGDNQIRQKMLTWVAAQASKELVIEHTSAIVAQDTQIGLSTFIGAGSIVNTKVKIGRGVIINTGAIIEHECQIGDFAHIGPGAVLAGNVSVDELCFIGANATVKQGVSIGKNSIIGAGSVVLCDIPPNTVFAGNPAKQIRKNE
jgi:sugar O-acyltransferase (sialic acid O-acetyltransferase NeuD family)